ncbi:MAG: hypothetical protein ABFD52_06850 [Acidobacteriota bacterium]
MDIVQAFEDPKLFGSMIKDQASWANWKIFLRALFGLELSSADLIAFERFTGRTKPPAGRFNRALALCARRAGKSRMAAFIAVYLALFYDWKPYLAPGETAVIACVAVDRVQAKVIFRYIAEILKLPAFRYAKAKELSDEIQLANGITISVRTCDFRSLRGPSYCAIIMDEAAFFRVDGSNPSEEILRSVEPGMASLPGSLLLILSSPYGKFGIVWEEYRRSFGNNDAETLVWKAPTLDMNPTIGKGIVDKALATDYVSARSEYLAEFRDDIETFLTTESIEAVIVPGRKALPRLDGVRYFGFLDSSSGMADAAAAAIAHRETGGKVILDRLEVRPSPHSPLDVLKGFMGIFKEYGIFEVRADRYAVGFTSQAIAESGLKYVPSDLDKSSIFREFEPLVTTGQVELLDHKQLFQELRGLERRTRSGGKDIVDHFPGAHDDAANAAAGACVLAQKPPMRREIIWL